MDNNRVSNSASLTGESSESGRPAAMIQVESHSPSRSNPNCTVEESKVKEEEITISDSAVATEVFDGHLSDSSGNESLQMSTGSAEILQLVPAPNSSNLGQGIVSLGQQNSPVLSVVTIEHPMEPLSWAEQVEQEEAEAQMAIEGVSSITAETEVRQMTTGGATNLASVPAHGSRNSDQRIESMGQQNTLALSGLTIKHPMEPGTWAEEVNPKKKQAVQLNLDFLVSDSWNRKRSSGDGIAQKSVMRKISNADILAKYSQPWINPGTENGDTPQHGGKQSKLESSQPATGSPVQNENDTLQSLGACALPIDFSVDNSGEWFNLEELNKFLAELSSDKKLRNTSVSVQKKINFNDKLVSNDWNDNGSPDEENIKREQLYQRVKIPRFGVSLEQVPLEPCLVPIYRQRLLQHRLSIIETTLARVLESLSGDEGVGNQVENHVRDRLRVLERDVEFDELSTATFNGIMSYLRRFDNWQD